MTRPSTAAPAVAAPSVPAAALRLLLAALLAVTLLVVPGTGVDQAHAASEDLVLAVEAEDLGPEPADREAEDNPARELAGYEDMDVMFTWGAAFLLLGLVVTLLVIGGGLWYLLVVRPRRQEAHG